MDQLLDILCGHSVTSLKLLAIEGMCVCIRKGVVRVCVCVCVCMCACMHTHTRIHTHACVSVHARV